MKTRAVLTVSIPIAEPQTQTNGWLWVTEPPNQNMDELTWVIDGSKRYASHWTLATTGCGVAVLDREGLLIAYATATPPSWVKTAGAAEAWALLLTLKENPFPPMVLTDCMALLHTVRAGPERAGSGKNTDARIWVEITALTGGSYKTLLHNLVWMPSHTSASLENVRVKSNGKRLTTYEWRANQLADTLAKTGALVSPLRDEANKVINVAGDALQQAAARLGVVTFAANAHTVEGVKEDGTAYTLTKRDSSTLPVALAKLRDETRTRRTAELVAKAANPPAVVLAAAPLVPLTREQERGLKRRTEVATRRLAEGAHLQLVVAGVAARATPQPDSATDRLAALRRRVLARVTGTG